MKLDKSNKLKIGLAAAVAILLAKLFVIQIVDERYKIDASNNSMVYTMIYPPRGIIDDRNGKILVGNKIAYDLVVTPKEVEEFDTLALCRSLMPAGERKNLSSACRYFGIDQENAHRALSDALCAHRLYQKLKEQYPEEENGLFLAKKLRYKAKKERTASKRQKEYLQDLIKCHRINITVQLDALSRSEASRMIDRIILQHGRLFPKGKHF